MFFIGVFYRFSPLQFGGRRVDWVVILLLTSVHSALMCRYILKALILKLIIAISTCYRVEYLGFIFRRR